MKKIILPTDFSENAYSAILYAQQLFKGVETTFYLLHTYTPAVVQVEHLLQKSDDHLGDSYQRQADEKLRILQQRLQKEVNYPEHTFILKAVFNMLPDEIHYMAKRKEADLVIMGTQGATGAKGILFGTNTTRVMRNSSCPLIVVPSGFQFKVLNTIGFPTDYEINYDKEQLEQLLSISTTHNASINVIHVTSEDGLSKEQSQNKAKLDQLLTETHHVFNDLPEQELIDAVNEFQISKPMSLLVMIKNKTTFFERLFVEPMIKKIGLQLNIPFMVIPHVEK